MLPQNESNLDKNIRLVVGFISLLLAFFVFKNVLQVIAFVIAALAIFTGFTGFCALYKLFGISTKK